jgi:hypothetical protein
MVREEHIRKIILAGASRLAFGGRDLNFGLQHIAFQKGALLMADYRWSSYGEAVAYKAIASRAQ